MSNDYHISTDKSLLDKDFINGFIKNSYWGKERTLEQTIKTIENSFCFGMYTKNGQQIGFGRIVTDYVFFGNVMDVFLDSDYQGKGLGNTLIEYMLSHSVVKDLQTIILKTKDAHSFYEKYGFNKIGDSNLYMSRDKQKLL
jgi:N-acetylglutamate synthase-like GNAT family acetyltransferase